MTVNPPRLPPDIVSMILENLPDFAALFSAVQTCRNFYSAFQNYSRQILKAIFLNQCRSVEKYSWGKVFRELVFIVCKDFVARDAARFILETAWEWFLQMEQEEVLIPIAVGLAHSYVLNERIDDAIDLLENICGGACPFRWSMSIHSKGTWRHYKEVQRRKDMTLYPALHRLANLYAEKGCDNGSIPRILHSRRLEYEELPTVLIEETRITYSTDSKTFSSEDTLVDGIIGYEYYRAGKQSRWSDFPLVVRACQLPHPVAFGATFLESKTRLELLTMRRLCSAPQIGFARPRRHPEYDKRM
ncbi:predicted protein [Histoplasma mississippiense (nom. inval.)]|uniref:predicted protein n=1 Tax=Ajellomyces capsulatus (strain NAm1 / WU24) TaxID=2059318 RepID=UPI000157D0EB|nr:predicted protein [Histoplasma mississippiense (nom. inval.)]EDN11070.1 predicted protein [Histoplasma mississippiense (nom. inval.)]